MLCIGASQPDSDPLNIYVMSSKVFILVLTSHKWGNQTAEFAPTWRSKPSQIFLWENRTAEFALTWRSKPSQILWRRFSRALEINTHRNIWMDLLLRVGAILAVQFSHLRGVNARIKPLEDMERHKCREDVTSESQPSLRIEMVDWWEWKLKIERKGGSKKNRKKGKGANAIWRKLRDVIAKQSRLDAEIWKYPYTSSIQIFGFITFGATKRRGETVMNEEPM